MTRSRFNDTHATLNIVVCAANACNVCHNCIYGMVLMYIYVLHCQGHMLNGGGIARQVENTRAY